MFSLRSDTSSQTETISAGSGYEVGRGLPGNSGKVGCASDLSVNDRKTHQRSHGLWEEQEPDLSGPPQGDHGGQRRRGEVRPHPAVHVRRVCGGLRAHQGGQLQEEGGAGRRGRPDRHPGHGGSGGLRRHQGQLLPQRRGLPARLLHHGARVLHRHVRVQGADPAGEGGGGHPAPPGGEQVGPGGAAPGVRRRGHSEGQRVGRPVRGDVGQDESQRGQGVLRPHEGGAQEKNGGEQRQKRAKRQEEEEALLLTLTGRDAAVTTGQNQNKLTQTGGAGNS